MREELTTETNNARFTRGNQTTKSTEHDETRREVEEGDQQEDPAAAAAQPSDPSLIEDREMQPPNNEQPPEHPQEPLVEQLPQPEQRRYADVARNHQPDDQNARNEPPARQNRRQFQSLLRLKDLPAKAAPEQISTADHPLAQYALSTPQRDPQAYEFLRVHIPTEDHPAISKRANIEHRFNQAARTTSGVISIFRLNNLEDVVRFRRNAEACANHYRRFGLDSDPFLPPHQLHNNRSRLGWKPSLINGTRWLPLLYQVVHITGNRRLTLEAKAIETFYQMEEIRLIELNRSCSEIYSAQGVSFEKIELRDLVYVEELDLNIAAARMSGSIDKLLEESRDSTRPPLSRKTAFVAARFALVPPQQGKACFAYTKRVQPTTRSGRGVRLVTETIPFEVKLAAGRFSTEPRSDNVYVCHPRQYLSSQQFAIGFPNSRESAVAYKRALEDSMPSLEEGGIAPIRIRDLFRSEHSEIWDRLQFFDNFTSDRERALETLSSTLALGASALEAQNHLERDYATRAATVQLVNVHQDFPVHGTITIFDKATEGGYRRHARVHLKMTHLYEAAILDSTVHENHITATFVMSQNESNRLMAELQIQGDVSVSALVRLQLPPSTSQPVLEATLKKFPLRTNRTSTGFEVIRRIYRAQDGRAGSGEVPIRYDNDRIPPSPLQTVFSNGNQINLSLEQRAVLSLGERRTPLSAIQAPYGTGKSFVAGVLATQTARQESGSIVLLAAITNTAVAKLALATYDLDDSQNFSVIRFVSKASASESIHTPVDLHKVLPTLVDQFGAEMSAKELTTCEAYTARRDLLSSFERGQLTDPEDIIRAEQALIEDAENQQDYEDMVKLLLKFKGLNVIATTIASALNLFGSNGILRLIRNRISMIIIDEGSQVPERTLSVLTHAIHRARMVILGDVAQLPPYSLLDRESSPNELSNRAALAVCLHSNDVSRIMLRNTFRGHPAFTHILSEIFYDGNLVPAARVEDRNRLAQCRSLRIANRRVPFVIATVPGTAQRNGAHSLVNNAELRAASEIVDRLSADFQPHEILVLALYKGQQNRAAELIGERAHVLTVDSAQGAEYAVSLVLTTRTSANAADNLNFFSCRHRAVVGLSRSKHGTIVLGHGVTLRSSAVWNDVYAAIDRVGNIHTVQQLLGN